MAVDKINQLTSLSFQKQLAFAYLSCERVYPHYLYFVDHFYFGDPDVVRKSIDFIQEGLFHPVDQGKLDTYMGDIYTCCPRPDNFEGFYASIAMDSGVVFYESINLLKRVDIPRILDDISTACTDAIDLYIQEKTIWKGVVLILKRKL